MSSTDATAEAPDLDPVDQNDTDPGNTTQPGDTGGDPAKDDDEEFMNMIYIALGALGVALLLFVVLYLLKRKLCPEKADQMDENGREIEVASPQSKWPSS